MKNGISSDVMQKTQDLLLFSSMVKLVTCYHCYLLDWVGPMAILSEVLEMEGKCDITGHPFKLMGGHVIHTHAWNH